MLGSNRNREERTDDSEAKPGESMITVTAGSKRPGTTSELFEEKGKIHLILCRHKSDEIYFFIVVFYQSIFGVAKKQINL